MGVLNIPTCRQDRLHASSLWATSLTVCNRTQPILLCSTGRLPLPDANTARVAGLSEEQITDIFSNAGKVERFRLVYDSETGRPKGFGFADYPDTDSASSAVRNLNDYEIMGRKLRVDFSNEQKSGDDDGSTNNQV